MSKIENLRRLLKSGNPATVALGKQIISSPEFHKARGLLLECNILLEVPCEPGGGIWAMMESAKGKCCPNQPRRRCVKCRALVCPAHVDSGGKCHACLKLAKPYYYMARSTITLSDIEEWADDYCKNQR